jgi:MFS family permease
MSICISGLLLGQTLGRVLAGCVADKASWRVVYIFSAAIQGTCLLVLYAVVPDFPAKSPTEKTTFAATTTTENNNLNRKSHLARRFGSCEWFKRLMLYCRMLLSMPKRLFTEPTCIQTGLIGMMGSACQVNSGVSFFLPPFQVVGNSD